MEAGIYHTLTVERISDYGLYLKDGEGAEVLLPNRYVSLTDKVGDEKEVFVYHDSEDRLVATTEHPIATVGQVAFLKVVDKTVHGAFLDWGLPAKHLFIPNRNQPGQMYGDQSYVVFIYRDNVTGRAVASSRLNSFISNDNITVSPHDEVDIMFAQQTPLGYRVIINNLHWGMVYTNQIFRPVAIGDRMKGYISKIAEDKRIDVVLTKEGYDGVKNAARELMDMICRQGGELPLGDGSDPAEIASKTGMSKKVFKRAAGFLLKAGLVEVAPGSIRLTKK